MYFDHESVVTRRVAIGCYFPTAPSGRLNARSKQRKTTNLKIKRIRSAMSQWYVIALIAVESSPPPPELFGKMLRHFSANEASSSSESRR
jgi:hypothetical protein